MSRNVFRFRRLRWGDPDKFKMLPGETTPPGAERRSVRKTGRAAGAWGDRALVALILLGAGLCAVLLA